MFKYHVEEAGVDERYQLISDTLMEVAAEIAPQGKRKKQITEEDIAIETLDRKRKELREIQDKTTSQKIEYTELVKTVRKKRRQRSRKKREEQIKSILTSGRGAQHINKLSRKKTRMHQMKQKDGNITNDRQEILNVCADFYQELYSSKSSESKPNIISPDQSAIPQVTVREVEVAIKEMKDNKAPGTDDITSDIIKIGGARIIKELTKLYNQIMEEKRIPVCWKEAKIILLHKKGDKTDIKNYRPISLLSHVYKIFTRILQTRMKRILDENQPREQAGFRSAYSTLDHLHALNQVIEKANEYNLELCVGYIDYEKAFDSVEHKDLFTALRKVGVNEGYVQLLEDIYTDATAKIHIENDVSKTINIERGVRRRDTISPKIFTTAMEDILKKLNLQERGLNVDGENLTDLRFADDVTLIATSVKDMEVQL